jgi:hypothetical protein
VIVCPWLTLCVPSANHIRFKQVVPLFSHAQPTLFRPLDIGSSALLRSLQCHSITFAQTRTLCGVSIYQMSSVTCNLSEAFPRKSMVERMLPLTIVSPETALICSLVAMPSQLNDRPFGMPLPLPQEICFSEHDMLSYFL